MGAQRLVRAVKYLDSAPFEVQFGYSVRAVDAAVDVCRTTSSDAASVLLGGVTGRGRRRR
ncbi:hypothetical protein [Streptomyces sp. NPDC101166]|uniref:hypothetical protein n=1 Tax=Streptomyces sp. NPDC101166 TaxID=3366120 RepID=UPI00382A6259